MHLAESAEGEFADVSAKGSAIPDTVNDEGQGEARGTQREGQAHFYTAETCRVTLTYLYKICVTPYKSDASKKGHNQHTCQLSLLPV
jgi:hypothetical protein